jgi:hypothetical protein
MTPRLSVGTLTLTRQWGPDHAWAIVAVTETAVIVAAASIAAHKHHATVQ